MGGKSVLSAQQKLGNEQKAETGRENDRADGIDLRCHATADRGEDIDGKRGIGPGHKAGDDVILQAEGEGEKPGRDEGRQEQWQEQQI